MKFENKKNNSLKILVIMALIVFIASGFWTNQAQNSTSTLETGFPGCPENSLCAKKIGEKRLLFLSYLKKYQDGIISIDALNLELQNKELFPITLKTEEKNIFNAELIRFTGPCKNEKVKSYQSEFFSSKDFSSTQLKYHFKLPKIFLQSDSSLSTAIGFSMDFEKPILVSSFSEGKINHFDFYFIKEDEGMYYYLKISGDGQFSIVDSPYKKFRIDPGLTKSNSTPCKTPNSEIHGACYSLYNTTEKKYQTFLIEQSCQHSVQ